MICNRLDAARVPRTGQLVRPVLLADSSADPARPAAGLAVRRQAGASPMW